MFILDEPDHDFNSARAFKIGVGKTRGFLKLLVQPSRRMKLTKMIEGLLGIFELAQEERDEEILRQNRRGLRAFRDRSNPLEEYNNVQFLQRFRLS